MTAVTLSAADLTTDRSAFTQFLNDVWVLTKRSLARIRREPETLSDVTIQPVMFVLMFAYVFGGAIGIPGGGDYHSYLIGGMLGMGLAQTAPGTAVAVVSVDPALLGTAGSPSYGRATMGHTPGCCSAM